MMIDDDDLSSSWRKVRRICPIDCCCLLLQIVLKTTVKTPFLNRLWNEVGVDLGLSVRGDLGKKNDAACSRSINDLHPFW